MGWARGACPRCGRDVPGRALAKTGPARAWVILAPHLADPGVFGKWCTERTDYVRVRRTDPGAPGPQREEARLR